MDNDTSNVIHNAVDKVLIGTLSLDYKTHLIVGTIVEHVLLANPPPEQYILNVACCIHIDILVWKC